MSLGCEKAHEKRSEAFFPIDLTPHPTSYFIFKIEAYILFRSLDPRIADLDPDSHYFALTQPPRFKHFITAPSSNLPGSNISLLCPHTTSQVQTFHYFTLTKPPRFKHFITSPSRNLPGSNISILRPHATSQVQTFHYFAPMQPPRFKHFKPYYRQEDKIDQNPFQVILGLKKMEMV